MSELSRLVVMISGSGSNLQAILDACETHRLPAQVCAVISNKPNAYGLVRAQSAGIPTLTLTRKKDGDRRLYDAALADAVSVYQPDWIVLAGWMHLLSSDFLERFPGRVINLHPALPGTFPGTHAIQRAFEAFQRHELNHTGVMVHLVPDEGVDNGPVLAQQRVEINTDDTLQSLEERIHLVEHHLLVSTLKQVLAS